MSRSEFHSAISFNTLDMAARFGRPAQTRRGLHISREFSPSSRKRAASPSPWKILPMRLARPSSLAAFHQGYASARSRLCFDIGHAHIERDASRCHLTRCAIASSPRISTIITAKRTSILLPYDGTIDWDAALAAFANAPQPVATGARIKSAAGRADPRSNSRRIRQAREKSG